MLESLLRRLLPTPAVSPPDLTPVPSELVLFVTATSGGCTASTACPAREVGNHRNGDFTAEFASGKSVPKFVGATAHKMSGLDYCAVFLVWKNGSWGHPMSNTGRCVSILAAGLEGREGREWICYDLSLLGYGRGAASVTTYITAGSLTIG